MGSMSNLRIPFQRYSVLFKINSKCNDSCDFCIERKFINAKGDDLSFDEIKKNFEYVNKKFMPDYVIITGGEPTLHPEFLKIVDYFYRQKMEFRVITNLIRFGDEKFLKKLLPYFKKGRNKIIGSINDLPGRGKTAKKRIEGLKNVLKHKLPLMLIVVIYKNNLEDLPELINYLTKLFKKYRYNKLVSIELRMIYVEGTLNSLLKKSLPTDFKKVKKCVQMAVDNVEKAGASLALWNFPLCWLKRVPKNINAGVQERTQRKLLKINKGFQLKRIQTRDFEKYFEKDKKCVLCEHNAYCSGLDNFYKKYILKTKN